jgi:hypothetical protein
MVQRDSGARAQERKGQESGDNQPPGLGQERRGRRHRSRDWFRPGHAIYEDICQRLIMVRGQFSRRGKKSREFVVEFGSSLRHGSSPCLATLHPTPARSPAQASSSLWDAPQIAAEGVKNP